MAVYPEFVTSKEFLRRVQGDLLLWRPPSNMKVSSKVDAIKHNKQEQGRGTQAMNYSKAIFLINKKVRAIKVSYEKPSGTNPNYDSKGNSIKLTMHKTMDPDVKVGDFVVVPTKTRHNMTICRVEEVDVDPCFEDSVEIEWIIAVVDKDVYEAHVEQEAVAINKIKSAELKKKRQELAEALIADAGDEIKELPIFDQNGKG